jgi:hypothetical protein
MVLGHPEPVESQSIGQLRQRNDILKYFLHRMADAG